MDQRTIRKWVSRGLLTAHSGPSGRLVDVDAVLVLATKMTRPVAHGPADKGTSRNDPGCDERDSEQAYYSAAQDRTGPILADPGVVALIDRLSRENVELAGRVGFLQSEVLHLEERIALLEAPKPEASDPLPASTSNHPAHLQNGQDSASYEREPYPWWRRLLNW